jgi:two-component system sensor histidine kinase AlgZ
MIESRKNERALPQDPDLRAKLYLPDFCSSSAVLGVVLIVELTALVLVLARNNEAIGFWTDLARTSMFLLWIGLCGAGLLCRLRNWIARGSVARGSLAVLGLVAVLVAFVSAATFAIGQSDAIGIGGVLGGLFPSDLWLFLLRNVFITLIVTSIALRYFYISHERQRSTELQAQARVHALQARIRPHFLFNSMNTIAALTRTNPARAEEAVQDLADLFRASLAERRSEISLQDELEVAQTYERIEKLRLGERLQVVWNTAHLPGDAIVPSLMLQPLLENAIYHGVEPRAGGGTITINGEVANGLITIVVRNPMPESAVTRDGNRVALANIRERLSLVYGPRSTVKAGRFDDEYIVTLRFPAMRSAQRQA